MKPVQLSLYEDLVAAWVPARHEWLKLRPLGNELVGALGNQKMFSYCACTFHSAWVVRLFFDLVFTFLLVDLYACVVFPNYSLKLYIYACIAFF